MDKQFNVRVYGIWIKENKLLVNEELIKGRQVIKLPGGGLEFGEGTIDGLRREFKEELYVDIDVLQHYYTTDFFQSSAYDDSQVISIYYKVSGNMPDTIINHVKGERTYWMDLQAVIADTFTLPIDRIVGTMLQNDFINNII